MKKLEKLEKYVRVPDTQFYGTYFYDGEDIELHNEEEIFNDDKGQPENRLKIVDIIENGIFKKHKEYEDLQKGIKETTDIEYPLKDNEMLIFVINEGFTKTHTPMIPINKAIERYKLLINEEVQDDTKGNER